MAAGTCQSLPPLPFLDGPAALGRALSCNHWRFLPGGYVPDPEGRRGKGGTRLWLRSLLVLGSELLDWKRYFFRLRSLLGIGPGPALFPFQASCLLVPACASVVRPGHPRRGIRFLVT